MQIEKQNYIDDQVEIDYVLKSKNSALAFMFVTLLFIYLQHFNEFYRDYAYAISSGVIFLAVLRYLNAYLYTNGKKNIRMAVIEVSTNVVLNCILWCAIGMISVLSFEENNFQILITFILLIGISASSIVTISHKPVIFIIMNILLLTPQVFYAVKRYQFTNDASMLWIAGYAVIYFVYNIRQGRVVYAELIKRFSMEFDLIKTLDEVALSKRNLEEESIKTFHASRLSSLGEMAGGIAHEINNPLTIIQGMTKSVASHNDSLLDEVSKTKLQKINSAAERIAKIVKGMKIISSKNDQIEHEPIKVSKVIDVSLGLFEERLKNENVSFQLENVTDPTVVCNPLQISQIIINLISNALDALQKYEGDHAIMIKISEDFLHHQVNIRIINSGPLLSDELANKIFEPFFSTKSLGQGTGLGLSISQTLAHSNGGKLNYEDYQGQVCFNLKLETHTL
jgi:signal transduction histidine kinase